MSWAINGFPLPKPDKFDIGYVEIADYTRDVSGNLYKDVVATIRKFTIEYNGLSTYEADNIRIFIETGGELTLNYEYNNQTLTAIVTVSQGTISRLPTLTEAYRISLVLEETTAL